LKEAAEKNRFVVWVRDAQEIVFFFRHVCSSRYH
jgi:hypothetical protein